jgi:hypothetical protein
MIAQSVLLSITQTAFHFFSDALIGLYAWLFRFTDLKESKPVGIADLTA